MKKGSAKSSKKKPATAVEEVHVDFSDPVQVLEALNLSNVGIVVQGLNKLKSFARPDHIDLLLEHDLLNKLTELILNKKSSAIIVDFSINLLSELLYFKSALKKTSENEELILFLYQQFKSKPVAVQVNCLKCISALTKIQSVCQLLFENCDLNLLFTRLSLNDPDVHTCILKVIYNLCQDIVIAERVVNLPGFSYKPFFNLSISNYPTVQHLALNLIIWFTTYDHLNILKEIFIEDGGVNGVMKILETHKWPDLHEKVFKILTNMSTMEHTFTKFGEDSLKKLISYVDDIESQKLQFISYKTIIAMCKKSTVALQMFIQSGLVEIIMNHLKDEETNSLFRLSIAGLALVSKNDTVLTKLEEDTHLLNLLTDVLNDKNKKLDWFIRYDAADSIYTLVSTSPLFLECFMENRDWENILKLLEYPSTQPYNMTLLLAKILKTVLLRVYENESCPGNFCSKFLHVVKYHMLNPNQFNPELKCVATEMIELLVQFPEFREKLKDKKIYRTFAKTMFKTNDNYDILESYLKLFITISEWDPVFIDELVFVHAIDWFINQKEIIRNLPMARRFLDLIFSKCPYLKIHYTNRLDLWDKIESGFFVQRSPVFDVKEYFKSLKSIVREKELKSRPIYHIDYGDKNWEEMARKRLTVTSTITTVGTFGLTESANTLTEMNECSVDEWDALKDPFLSNNLEELKSLLGYEPRQQVALDLYTILNRSEYLDKIQILAKFVDKIMSSLEITTEDYCRNHCFELHLSEIKEQLGSAVIPLGYVKLGMKFERALLFKVLGDQLNIPSAFVRGHCGNGWNEVYLTPEEFDLETVLETDKELEVLSRPTITEMENRTALGKRATLKKTSRVAAVANSDRRKSAKQNVMTKKQSKHTIKAEPAVKEEEEEEAVDPLPPLWYLKAYTSYMKTNHIVDLIMNPGHLITMDTVEADDYKTKSCCLHPYFIQRTPIPPLIKTSTVNI